MEKRQIRVDNRGFTLIELMVVLAIIAALVGIIGPRIFKQFGQANTRIAKTQIAQLEAALDSFRLDVGRYPSTSEGLNALFSGSVDGWDGPYLKKKAVPKDPWKRDYIYTSPGSRAEYELSSYGRDGQPGGSGEDADINSWE